MPITIKLKHPIKANGEALEKLTLDDPRVKHLRATSGAKDEVERVCLLLGELAGLAPSAVDQIHMHDFTEIAKVLGDFFGAPPPTGGT